MLLSVQHPSASLERSQSIAVLVNELRYGSSMKGMTIIRKGTGFYAMAGYRPEPISDLKLADTISISRIGRRNAVIRTAGPNEMLPKTKWEFSATYRNALSKFLNSKVISAYFQLPMHFTPHESKDGYTINICRAPAKVGSIISYRFSSKGMLLGTVYGY